MPDLSAFDLEAIAMALSEQESYDYRWLLDPSNGETVFWTSDTGIDGSNPVDLDELDHLLPIEPIPSRVWFRDMVDFVEGISSDTAGRRLGRALEGSKPFRRFRDALHNEPQQELVAAWHAFRDVRASRRSVEWLTDQGLIEAEQAQRYLADHPEPPLP